MLRTIRLGWLLATAATVIGLLGVAPAGAQTPGRRRAPAIAAFEGTTIDLTQDWDAAQACLIWRQGGVVECFRTDAELEARERQLEPVREQLAAAQAAAGRAADGGVTSTGSVLAAASYSCTSSLDLYEHPWYGGRRLSFWDRGMWQNLADYGFDNQLSSFIVGACYVYLADYNWGAGYWYPGATSSYHPESSMYWGWDNRVSSLYIT